MENGEQLRFEKESKFTYTDRINHPSHKIYTNIDFLNHLSLSIGPQTEEIKRGRDSRRHSSMMPVQNVRHTHPEKHENTNDHLEEGLPQAN